MGVKTLDHYHSQNGSPKLAKKVCSSSCNSGCCSCLMQGYCLNPLRADIDNDQLLIPFSFCKVHQLCSGDKFCCMAHSWQFFIILSTSRSSPGHHIYVAMRIKFHFHNSRMRSVQLYQQETSPWVKYNNNSGSPQKNSLHQLIIGLFSDKTVSVPHSHPFVASPLTHTGTHVKV